MIYFYQRLIANYRVLIFEKLNNKLNGKLLMIYGSINKKEGFSDFINQDRGYKSCLVFTKSIINGSIIIQNIFKPFFLYKLPKAIIIEHNPRNLGIFILIFISKLFKIPFILHGHGSSRRRLDDNRSLKDYVHRYLIDSCDAYVCYTDEIKKKLSLIKSKNSIFVANNTLETKVLFNLRQDLEKVGKNGVKKKLNLNCKNYIIFMGRLSKDKNIDFLLDLLGVLEKKGNNIGSIIIGGGEKENFVKNYITSRGLRNCIYLGNIPDWQKSALYLFSSDIMIIPGAVGLAVNHAFCFGLPVITSAQEKTGPFHGPEISYIKNNYNGMIIDSNIESYEVAILNILKNKKSFYQNSKKFAEKNLSSDLMVNGFIKAIKYVNE